MNKDWSIDLEHGEYEHNITLVIEDAIQAVADTEKGYYVNLVTPNRFGNPEKFLSQEITSHYGKQIKMKFIDQCGCGGYVLRVWKI